MSGRDLTQRPREQFAIDFALMTEEEARRYPVLFDIVRARVKPQRDAQRRKSRKRYWWRFGEPTIGLREATRDLSRCIVTPETSKHRFFRFLSPDVACAHKIVVIALSEGYHLGVLSSTPHAVWAKAAGGRLGVGNDPVYQKSLTFDPFPFPETAPAVRDRIADIAERIEVHRENALAREEAITMTGVYNVLEALHTGAELSPTERKIHEIAACGVLKDLHEELDALVAEAYGWPWPLEEEEILDRLVRLHDRRVMEEEQGKVRWLRPEFQIPRFGEDMVSGGELDLAVEELESEAQEGPRPWPESTVDQIAALKAAVEDTPGTAEEIRGRFDGAPPRLVERHLETLQIVGELRRGEDDTYRLPLGVEGAV